MTQTPPTQTPPTQTPLAQTVASFRERARVEAERYGSDPWVFVRELLQNARDAGATRVSFTVERGNGIERITCRDNGAGMSFAESRRYLFTLYASSKRQAEHQAGRFGVGFWAILRFQPSRIIIRSRCAAERGWQVRLDGTLEQVEQKLVQAPAGTEIVLERPARDHATGLTGQVLAAAAGDGRYLICRDQPRRPLQITVNGRRANAVFALPSPSISFRRRGLRGVVGLGHQQQVELFVHGLRVRTAASLDDLLSEEPAGPGLPELPQGLVPRVLLDSDRLEVLLARSDAREDRRLQRSVAITQHELARLVRSQLDRTAPASLPRRCLEGLQRLWAHAAVRRSAAAIGVVLVLLATTVLVARLLPRPGRTRSAAVRSGVAGPGLTVPVPYRDPGPAYHGPAVDALAPVGSIDLQYLPATRHLLLAALRVEEMDRLGQPLTGPPVRAHLRPYPAVSCHRDCVEIELTVAAGTGWCRLPIPTGTVIEQGHVAMEGVGVTTVLATPAGEPVLWLDEPFSGRLSYRAGAAPAEPPRAARNLAWPVLPPAVAERAAALAALPEVEQVPAALVLVRSLVAYDRSRLTIERYLAARQAGLGLLEQALGIGAGDCDVQSSLLVAVLRRAGRQARLAIGYVGSIGRAMPGQHAWVEVLDHQGHWQVADASTTAARPSSRQAAGVPQPEPREPADPGDGPATSRSRPALAAGWPDLLAGLLWLLAAGAFASAVVAAHRLTANHTLHLQERPDMAALLAGALRRPEAFQQVGSLFSRPLVPLLGNRLLSLRRAQRLAARARLLRSGGETRLARRAVSRGAPIIDTGTAAGAVVAELLGAADVDHWDRLLTGARRETVGETVNQALRGLGEPWQVTVAAGAETALTTVDLRALRTRRPPERLVVIAEETTLYRSAAHLCQQRPWQAVLLVVDAAAHHLDLPTPQRSRLLGTLAARALDERAELEGPGP